MNQEEKLFYEEIRDKKKASHGIHGRASRTKGFKGKVYFPSDLMSRKEKREYTKPGKVETYYMDERDINLVKSLEEIEKMNPEEARSYILRIKSKYTNKQLRNHWGLKSDYYLYNKLYKKYNVPTEKERTAAATEARMRKRAIELYGQAEERPQAILTPAQTQEDTSRMRLVLSGVFSGKEAGDRILALASVLQKEINYKVRLMVEE
jgi:hypothetical protein